MGFFDDMPSATKGGRNPYFAPDSEFRVEVESLLWYASKNTKPGKAGNYHFKLTGVIEETNATAAQNTDSSRVVATEAGEVAIQLLTFKPDTRTPGSNAQNPNELPQGDLKHILRVVYDEMVAQGRLDPTSAPFPTSGAGFKDMVDAFSADDQPASKLTLGLRTNNQPTEKGFFTNHTWFLSDGFVVHPRGAPKTKTVAEVDPDAIPF